MKTIISDLVSTMATTRITRSILMQYAERQLYRNIQTAFPSELEAIKKKKYAWTTALLHGVMKNLSKGYISKELIQKLSHSLIEGAFHEDRETFRLRLEAFRQKNGVYPPSFFVISPTQRCNLNCKGCYAGSGSDTCPTLSWNLVRNFIREFHDEGCGRFIVISGGEPLMYRSEGKTLLDLAAEFPDIFFMFYTNGTLINKKTASRMRQLSNIIPCISVEGYEKETDERRGRGTFKKIMQAMENLRQEGVPFAMSVTSTSQNVDLLLDNDFYDFYFEQQGCSFMWQFQLMPIGRGKEVFDLMPTPEQRVKLYRKLEYLIEEKKYCIADFWNSGVLSQGCVAYGRKGGYLHIDWNGNVMPCVFVPYVTDNIIKARSEGRKLGSILRSPFLANGRKWQKEYVLDRYDNPDNMLMPCSIRDHYKNFCSNIITEGTQGEDDTATAILSDKEYYKKMCKYDRELEKLTGEIWDREYMAKNLKRKKRTIPG